MSGGSKIIVVKKKKVVAGGHHGGSWKVAYADFVTAMMAFFLVMWIMGMDQGVKDLVEGYFSNPVGFRRSFSGGANPISAGNSPANIDIRRENLRWRDAQRRAFEQSAERIEEGLQVTGLQGLSTGVEVVVTDDGLRIEIMDTEDGQTFFTKASSAIKPSLEQVMKVIAGELRGLPNVVVVEGHTDALPFVGFGEYSNWELSVDRANAARRTLVKHGLAGIRVVEVRGYADKVPKIVGQPLDPRNRRISVLLPFDQIPQVDLFIADSVGLSGRGGSP